MTSDDGVIWSADDVAPTSYLLETGPYREAVETIGSGEKAAKHEGEGRREIR